MSAYFHAGTFYLLGAAVLALFGALVAARLRAIARPLPRRVSVSVLIAWISTAVVLVASGGQLSRITAIFSAHAILTTSTPIAPADDEAITPGSQLPSETESARLLSEPLIFPQVVNDFLSRGERWASADSSQLVDSAVETLSLLPEPDQTRAFAANGASYWRYRLAAERLLWTGGCEAPDQLRACIDHAHPNVRSTAALTLALLGDHTAIPKLLDRLNSETVYPVQCAIAEAILQLFDPDEIESGEAFAQSLPERTPQRLLITAARRGASLSAVPDNTTGLWNCPTRPDCWRPVQCGDTLDDLSVCDVIGQPIQLSEAAAGGRLLISFVTGDHCYMCDAFLGGILIPEAERASTAESVLLILPHTPRRARAYADRFGLLRPDAAVRVIADPQAELAARFGIARQYVLHSEWCNPPAAFLLDHQLTLRWSHVGKTVMDRATVFPKEF